jgi:hypothetical protein
MFSQICMDAERKAMDEFERIGEVCNDGNQFIDPGASAVMCGKCGRVESAVM